MATKFVRNLTSIASTSTLSANFSNAVSGAHIPGLASVNLVLCKQAHDAHRHSGATSTRRGFHAGRQPAQLRLANDGNRRNGTELLLPQSLAKRTTSSRNSQIESKRAPAIPAVYTSMEQVSRLVPEFEAMPQRSNVFMATPNHFDVTYVINPHMEGKVGTVDKGRCLEQWSRAREAIKSLGVGVFEVEGKKGLPDMVYSANLGLPHLGQSGVEVMMSNMAVDERKGETAHFAETCEKHGYKVDYLPDHLDFEGQGDALWHVEKKLLWAGYGFRSNLKAYEILAEKWQVPIIALKLHDPYFYHIDTCLAVLRHDTALYYPGAFTPDGVAIIRKLFPKLVEATEEDAKLRLACNSFSPDGENVVLNAGSRETTKRLKAAGFNPVEVDVSEFLKGGGSVCCMKMFTW